MKNYNTSTRLKEIMSERNLRQVDLLELVKPFCQKYNIKISLGNSLALGLEFKMGAEIIKTVIVRSLDELLILAFIIILRAILAVLIHWEIKTEKKMVASENINETK